MLLSNINKMIRYKSFLHICVIFHHFQMELMMGIHAEMQYRHNKSVVYVTFIKQTLSISWQTQTITIVMLFNVVWRINQWFTCVCSQYMSENMMLKDTVQHHISYLIYSYNQWIDLWKTSVFKLKVNSNLCFI